MKKKIWKKYEINALDWNYNVQRGGRLFNPSHFTYDRTKKQREKSENSYLSGFRRLLK